MNNYKKTFVIAGILITSINSLFAARLYIDSPKTVSSNREPLTVMILLESEDDIVSGISGDFSFSSELFDVSTISTQNGIVSLWATPPHITQEKFFDQRTHITFEGAVLGGFSGLRNPYTTKVFPGIVFTVLLTPKQKGDDTLLLNNIELHAYDSEGTILSSKSDSKKVSIPLLTGVTKPSPSLHKEISNTVSASINKDELISNSSPYLFVYDADSSKTIDHILIAESNDDNSEHIDDILWKEVVNPYVFNHALQKKYIHIKVIYTNNTYTYTTLTPVENSQLLSNSSRILMYILLVVSLVYFYGKKFFSKNSKFS